MQENTITLYQLNKLIQETLKVSINQPFWVKAEIAQVKENFSGHCYLELVEKDAASDRIVAQSKAIVWSNTFRILKPYFETTTGRKLSEGLNILICVKVEFHEVYGLSLVISDIDPTFTVGDLALKKAETIRRLKEEGIFDMNRELEISLVPQRIAVISSETAAGYTDFVTHLNENPFRFKFFIKLFPAFMQGDKAEESIVAALEQINNEAGNFDVVAIIRGGGSQVDLSCFDSYWLALHVAQFPLPVLTGIGHEQDDSITDMVARFRLKTPTAVAGFLIESLNNFEEGLEEFYNRAFDYVKEYIAHQTSYLEKAAFSIPVIVKDRVQKASGILRDLTYSTSSIIEKKIGKQQFNHEIKVQKISSALKHFYFRQRQSLNESISNLENKLAALIKLQQSKLNLWENTSNLVNPDNILKKGFSITMLDNLLVTESNAVTEKDIIKTRLHKGFIVSEVKKTGKDK